METSGEALGLSSTINTSTFLDAGTNNIDVHMIKNSEWGAVVILSLSAYGGYTGTTISDINTYSTGSSNYTGVSGLGNGWEFMATETVVDGSKKGLTATYSSADARYYDSYIWHDEGSTEATRNAFWTNNYSGTSHYGDGMYEMNQIVADKCPSATRSIVSSSGPWFLRGSSFALASGVLNDGSSYSCRAVVVCGSGL